MEDQSVIKEKLKIKRKNISSGLSFFGEFIRVEKERGKKKRREEEEEEEE